MGQKMTAEQALARSHQGTYLFTPKRLKTILDTMAEIPVKSIACRKVGISRSTIDKWLKKSETGKPGDGFDVIIDGEPMRFHEAFAGKCSEGIDKVEAQAIRVATGEAREVLTHHGRVQYKADPDMAALLGLPLDDPRCYLRDENGEAVPETVPLFEPDMTRFILKTHRPDQYGDRSKVDVTYRGGVLVVGMKQSPEELEQMYGGELELPKLDFVVEDVDTTE